MLSRKQLAQFIIGLMFAFCASASQAAGTSAIYSVYFRTHYYNSGLFVEIRANCSHGVFIDLSSNNGASYYDGPQRGALNGLWKVNLPTLAAGVNHRVLIACHRDASHGVVWEYNVYYKNGSLSGTYRIRAFNF